MYLGAGSATTCSARCLGKDLGFGGSPVSSIKRDDGRKQPGCFLWNTAVRVSQILDRAIWCHIFCFLSFVLLTVWVSGFEASRLLEHHGSFGSSSLYWWFPLPSAAIWVQQKGLRVSSFKDTVICILYTVFFFDFNFLNNIVAPQFEESMSALGWSQDGCRRQDDLPVSTVPKDAATAVRHDRHNGGRGWYIDAGKVENGSSGEYIYIYMDVSKNRDGYPPNHLLDNKVFPL